jgi:hypothetical protein
VLHDLVRGYAAGLARADVGEAGIRAAVERSLDHCLHTELVSTGIVLPVTVTVAPPAPGVRPERLADEAALQDWARAEHQVVLQAIAQAAAAGLITPAWQLFQGQAWLVGGEGYWADFRAVAEAVLAAAEAAGDQVALGWTHLVIGRHLTFIGAGNQDLARALDHFRRAGDLSGQAWSHLAASLASSVMGDWAEGVTQSGQALALFRQTGDQAGQGWALAGLGGRPRPPGQLRPGARLRPAGPGGGSCDRRPHGVGHGVGRARCRAFPARRARPGAHLLPPGPGLGPRPEEFAGPIDAGQHAGRVRRRLPGDR